MLLKKETKKIRPTVAFIVALAIVLVGVGGALAADTGWKNPSSDAADTGGDGDGFERNPADAYADGPGVTENRDGQGDRHRYYSYGFSIPANATINGIAVRLDWYLDDETGTSSMGVELSWDGGSSWTTAKTDSTKTKSEHTTILGELADDWGHGWTVAQINDNFVVRLTCSSDKNDRDFFLDWVPVRVYYTPNQPPVVGDIPDQTIAEGQSFTTFDLDDYVEDPDDTDAEMTWTYSGNTELTVSINGNHVATIGIPNVDWNGCETITFTATDPGSLSDSDPATFTVNAMNDAPVVSDIPNQTIDEGNTFTAIDLDAYVTDVDNTDAEMTWSSSGNTELTVSINGNHVATISIPNIDWNGCETITFTATDSGSLSDSDPATFTVNAVNDAPVTQDDAYSTNEDTQLNIAAPGVLANDSDVDGDGLTAVLDTTTSNGTLTLNSDGSFSYTPNRNFNGTDTFTYHADDGTAASNVAIVTINVGVVNDPPVANDDSDTMPEDTPVSTNVVANDTDVDGTVVSSTVAIASGPSNGSILNNGDGTVTYTPNANFNGSDIYTYTVQDSDGATSNVATVTITVGSVNDLPIANDDLVLTDEDTPLPIEVTLNDDDPDGTIDPTMIKINDAPESGTVQVARDGTITYSPAPDFSGIDLFTYTVDDNKGATSNVATVVVTVVEVNDPPIAEDDLATTEAGVPVSIAVLINDTDPDGSLIPGTVTTLSEPESGTATVNRDGTITYTSVDGLVGTDQFTYTVEDDQDAISNEATVTVEVLEIAGAGDGELATQEPMSSVRFLKRDTDDISWFVLAEPEKKDGSYYILAVDSTVLEELALSADIQPTETRAGARLEVGLEVTQEERRAYGWPWVRVTQPELAEAEAAGGAGAAAEQGAGFTFSGRYTNGVYWLGIDTAKLLPGRYNVWVVYGAGKTVLVPIEVLP